jgi:hypothetical protein
MSAYTKKKFQKLREIEYPYANRCSDRQMILLYALFIIGSLIGILKIWFGQPLMTVTSESERVTPISTVEWFELFLLAGTLLASTVGTYISLIREIRRGRRSACSAGDVRGDR